MPAMKIMRRGGDGDTGPNTSKATSETGSDSKDKPLSAKEKCDPSFAILIHLLTIFPGYLEKREKQRTIKQESEYLAKTRRLAMPRQV
jgi:hypothetical protein